MGAVVKVYPQTATICTLSGRRFRPLDMTVDDVSSLDIANALANICRYNGQLTEFYSVGQHSCLMYDYAILFGLKTVAPQVLMHDTSEAYCGDLITPLKQMPEFGYYEEVEDHVWSVIAERYGLPLVHDPLVKELDLWIRIAETRDLRPNAPPYKLDRSNSFYGYHLDPIIPWGPKKSKTQLIKRMNQIGIQVK